MKEDIHPQYHDVLFVDSSTGTKFLVGSTLQTEEREAYEGKEYPVCRVAISSASHPFFTGSNQFLDTEGRVDKFTKRYQKKREMELKKKKDEEEKKETAKKSAKSKKKK